jgi:hypothetical protein
MPIFFKKKKGNVESNGFLKSKKIKIAEWLNRRVNNYSPLQKKIGLFGFCILFGALCFYMLRESVYRQSVKNQVLIITHLRSGMPMRYRDSLRLKEIMLENILKSQNK